MNVPQVHLIAGTRPNFMKVAPLYHALKGVDWCRPVLIHTGQHYDENMSDAFFRDFGLPTPDHALNVGSGSHAEQTAGVMVAYERICHARRPDWTIVVGDVNSTLACALVAAKLCISLAHLEAGLRSGDRAMPEEINRIVTDSLSDLLWTHSPEADDNLRAEGKADHQIVRVGNIMIDAYELQRGRIESARACIGKPAPRTPLHARSDQPINAAVTRDQAPNPNAHEPRRTAPRPQAVARPALTNTRRNSPPQKFATVLRNNQQACR